MDAGDDDILNVDELTTAQIEDVLRMFYNVEEWECRGDTEKMVLNILFIAYIKNEELRNKFSLGSFLNIMCNVFIIPIQEENDVIHYKIMECLDGDIYTLPDYLRLLINAFTVIQANNDTSQILGKRIIVLPHLGRGMREQLHEQYCVREYFVYGIDFGLNNHEKTGKQ